MLLICLSLVSLCLMIIYVSSLAECIYGAAALALFCYLTNDNVIDKKLDYLLLYFNTLP
ncbi:hypothetical protein SAMN05421503_0546 [Terribacillus aidingensis]|uniref:Uncharacterized protein n=1 Tax=Terribacillus aidingensis TaxID=586416 RepID=A0A285N491_9BACI|nr:hypothetical protein SAMN05421503_0546 [Terribacillus aidingensis]